jgi:hypothetical protein
MRSATSPAARATRTRSICPPSGLGRRQVSPWLLGRIAAKDAGGILTVNGEQVAEIFGDFDPATDLILA